RRPPGRRRYSGGGRNCRSGHRCSRIRGRTGRSALPVRVFQKRSGPDRLGPRGPILHKSFYLLNERSPLVAKKEAEPTTGLVVAGMIGGYVSARVTKVRPLGGVVLEIGRAHV